MIDRSHALPLTRQAEALGVSRGAVYYQLRPISEADLGLMRRIDEVHLEMPWFEARGHFSAPKASIRAFRQSSSVRVAIVTANASSTPFTFTRGLQLYPEAGPSPHEFLKRQIL